MIYIGTYVNLQCNNCELELGRFEELADALRFIEVQELCTNGDAVYCADCNPKHGEDDDD